MATFKIILNQPAYEPQVLASGLGYEESMTACGILCTALKAMHRTDVTCDRVMEEIPADEIAFTKYTITVRHQSTVYGLANALASLAVRLAREPDFRDDQSRTFPGLFTDRETTIFAGQYASGIKKGNK